MFTDRVARAIASGEVVHVFRRWSVARVRAGGTQRTSAGIIEIVAVEPVAASDITDEAARAAGERDAAAVFAAFRGAAADQIFRITVRGAGPDERDALSERAVLSQAEVAEITAALARLDRASRRGPWTAPVLRAIAANASLRAADLALLLDRDRDSLKLDIRKLKNLGLTHSLDTGYRIAPRGAAYLRVID
ncbi:ASCH domain-containing protein [Nocardia sp. 2]|uniref:ASCH domain-containing protein n=1 Tax=Nocardia acididurans TaxID=2802282 RepID=A0ABS1M8X1_9NOCA|nr:ASCH domain-containing protein [Nocardia acididurans]MBL1077041.1 ASCH domain-containing protein [Nocardia acididurans]